jgi:hypothetical protein
MVGSAVFFFVVAAVVVGVAYLAHRADQRRRAAAVALARGKGYEIDVADKAPPGLPFDLFEIGQSRSARRGGSATRSGGPASTTARSSTGTRPGRARTSRPTGGRAPSCSCRSRART